MQAWQPADNMVDLSSSPYPRLKEAEWPRAQAAAGVASPTSYEALFDELLAYSPDAQASAANADDDMRSTQGGCANNANSDKLFGVTSQGTASRSHSKVDRMLSRIDVFECRSSGMETPTACSDQLNSHQPSSMSGGMSEDMHGSCSPCAREGSECRDQGMGDMNPSTSGSGSEATLQSPSKNHSGQEGMASQCCDGDPADPSDLLLLKKAKNRESAQRTRQRREDAVAELEAEADRVVAANRKLIVQLHGLITQVQKGSQENRRLESLLHQLKPPETIAHAHHAEPHADGAVAQQCVLATSQTADICVDVAAAVQASQQCIVDTVGDKRRAEKLVASTLSHTQGDAVTALAQLLDLLTGCQPAAQ